MKKAQHRIVWLIKALGFQHWYLLRGWISNYERDDQQEQYKSARIAEAEPRSHGQDRETRETKFDTEPGDQRDESHKINQCGRVCAEIRWLPLGDIIHHGFHAHDFPSQDQRR